MRTNHLLSLSMLLAAAACSTPTQAFTFKAIDAGENPRPCMVVVNDDWPAAFEKNQYVNVDKDELTLTLTFTSSEVEVTIAPVIVENGKVTRVPKTRKEARDYSGFNDETRRLMVGDPKLQMFILPRKAGGS